MGIKLNSSVRWSATTTLAAILAAGCGGAWAQSVTEETVELLPQVNVTDTRLTGLGTGTATGTGPGGIVPSSGGITGTSTTVITAEDIARSPEQSLPYILSREAGVQVQNLYGGVNGARSVVDMRGFGAAATSNVLFLINGRRINDLDMVGVDLAAIPRESIERIEVTRGNSGAVLYGDGAMGGVINIVTKNSVGQTPGGRFDAAFGSFNYKEANVSLGGSKGPWSASLFGTAIDSDGYRVNNGYRQYGAVADVRYTYEQGSVYLNLSADDQHLGLPGHRRYSPAEGNFSLITNRRGAFSPYDFADKRGQNATLGIAHMLAQGVELIVDGGVRRKEEQAQYYVSSEALATKNPMQAVDTTLTTASFTPRLRINSTLWGLPTTATGGFDYYHADFGSKRPLTLGGLPIHDYDLKQSSAALYWQQTVTLPTNTNISGGVRIQRTSVNAGDTFNPNAPGAFPLVCDNWGCYGDQAGVPLDQDQTNRAYHLGIEHRFTPNLVGFARMAQSFRVPNVDERVGMVTSMNGVPTTFDLKTQKSHDWEAGVRVNIGTFEAQWSYYNMNLTDEIHFRYGPNYVANNINLDPTRRHGHETIATWQVTDTFRLRGALSYTRAVFREGIFAGNDVPLVSRWTGNIGFSWDIWEKYLTLDTVVRYVGKRRMDNDQLNLQPMIPEYTAVDVRIGGQVDQFFWSFSVQNLFNADYFDYAIASPYPYGFGSLLGTYNAYPQPGRTFMAKAGVKW